jgi:hypothetical protein
MSNSVTSHSDWQEFSPVRRLRAVVAILFVIWLALVFLLGARGVRTAPRRATAFLIDGGREPHHRFSSRVLDQPTIP